MSDHGSLPATKNEAQVSGSPLFFTGVACSKGHLSPRYVSSGGCSVCVGDFRQARDQRLKLCVRCQHKFKGRRCPCAPKIKRTEEEKAEHREAMRRWRLENPARYKAYMLSIRPNILLSVSRGAAKRGGYAPLAVADASELRSWLDQQPKSCRICERNDRRLVIDHCHTTGRLRGLLCNHCNRLVGTVESFGPQLIEIRIYLGEEPTEAGSGASPTLSNLVRKILKTPHIRLAPSFRTALVRALNDYDSTVVRTLNEDMEIERPTPEGLVRCSHCSRPFIPKRVTQIYCQPKCRIDAGNRRNNAIRPIGVGRTVDP